jgi:hypothetical protein
MNAMIGGTSISPATVNARTKMVITIATALLDKRAKIKNAKLNPCTSKFPLAARLALGTHSRSILHFHMPAILS